MTADYTEKKPCGIYELKSENGRISYKIFASNEDLKLYLKKDKGKICDKMKPVFSVEEYKEYPMFVSSFSSEKLAAAWNHRHPWRY